jgi:hypothetical protein
MPYQIDGYCRYTHPGRADYCKPAGRNTGVGAIKTNDCSKGNKKPASVVAAGGRGEKISMCLLYFTLISTPLTHGDKMVKSKS